jgi:site-specific recombinase XerD
MAKLHLIQRKNKIKKDGLGPIYIQIIQDRSARYISTGVEVSKNDWDPKSRTIKKSHPNSVRYNALLRKKLSEAEATLLDINLSEQNLNSKEIKEAVKGKEQSDFFVFAEGYIVELNSRGQHASYKRFKSIVEKLKDYCNSQPLKMNKISVQFLQNYETHLADKHKNKTNTIHSNLKVIRRILNLAIDRGILDEKYNPFKRMKLKTEESKKDYLTEKELILMEGLELNPNQKISIHRDMYVFAVYTGGIRVSDILQLKWENFDGERIEFIVKKTKRNQVIKLPNKALKIINYYREKALLAGKGKIKRSSFIFPVLNELDDLQNPVTLLNKISGATALINKNLKTIAKMANINKQISFHTSRHSFATQALKKGMRMEYVGKIMGHKDLKETQIYAKIVNEELEKAMEIFN